MKILVAFPEKDVAGSVAQCLLQLGWPEPGLVETSDEAVEWINAQGGCDLLITEVYLSPADGFTLRDTIQPHIPGMRTIFSSGYDISPYVDRLEGAPFLARPVDSDALRQCLEELFGASTEASASAPTEPVPAEPAPAPKAVAAVSPAVKATASVSAKPAPAVKAAPAPSGPAPASEMLPDDLVGNTMGKFEIEARLAERDGATIYRARQTNVGRLVSLHLLNAEAPPAESTRFLADAKAKARLSHNRVAAVYEAGETGGRCFYSCEHIGAPSLEKFQAAGAKITGTTALETIRMVADVLDTCAKQDIPHTPVSAGTILLKTGGLPRMANIACEIPCPGAGSASDMKALGQALLQTLDRTPASTAAREVAMRLVQAETSPLTWEQAGALAAEAMPKSKPKDLEKIQAQEIAINRAVDESRKSHKTRMIVGSAISLALTGAALFAIYYQITKSVINVEDLGVLVEIPAGEFDFQGTRISLPKFYISKYEVSIAEYAEFLKFLEKNPGKAAEFAHPDQPPGKSHVPEGWADMNEIQPPNPGYYQRAKKWNSYQGAPLTLDSPVFGVDWFDAHAYAKWKGRRLPTEQEWEKAARGKRGGKHPWGDTDPQEKANLGFDFTPNPEEKVGGEKDGFKRSSPVDQPGGDVSDYGVRNMAGNVSEWTATWDEDAMGGGIKVPVYRGNNWRTVDEKTAMRRGTQLSELQSNEALGFRTASDTPE